MQFRPIATILAKNMKPDKIIKQHEKFLRNSLNECMYKVGQLSKAAAQSDGHTKESREEALYWLNNAIAYREALTNLLILLGNPTGELTAVKIN